MTEDTHLLCRYLDDRSEEAFTELVSRHVDLVYFAALRRVGGDRHLAEEVTQSVFFDFARKAPSLKTRAVLAGWLYTSTRFSAAQAVRTEQRRRTHEQEAQAMNELHAAPEPNWNQLRPIIDEVMDALNERDREAVLLRFYENLSFAEIGAKFSLSPDGARMRVERALGKLRRLLARRGIASTSVALAEIFASQSGAAAPSGLVARIVAAVFNPAVAVTAVTFGLWKVLAVLAIAAIATGLVVYGANRTHPPAVASGLVSQISRVGQNLTDPITPSDSSSQAADNSSLGQPGSSPAEADAIKKNREDFYDRMDSDPEFRASMIALAKSRLDLFYGPLFKDLNLPADKLDRFKDLLVELNSVYTDVHEALKTEGPNISPDQRHAYVKGLDDILVPPIDDKIKALLTADEYAQFRDYNEDLQQWVTAHEVARSAQSTGTPLTDEQANLLVVLLRGGAPKSTKIHWFEMYEATGLSVYPLGVSITVPIIEKAKRILSPVQLEGLRQVQTTRGEK